MDTIGQRIIHNLTLSVEQANEVCHDLDHLEKAGVWPECCVPEWATELAKHYDVLGAHHVIQQAGWRAAAKAYKLWNRGYCTGTEMMNTQENNDE